MRVKALAAGVLLAAALPCLAAAPPAHEAQRQAEKAMAAAYRELTALVSLEEKRRLLQEQRRWLGDRDTRCAALPDEPAGGSGASPRAACLEGSTKARTAELQAAAASLLAPVPAPPPAPPSGFRTPSQDGPRDGNSAVPGCTLGELPENVLVQAIGLYEGGLDTDVQLEPDGHETKVADVAVNYPGQDVVLVLMAYDPVLWQVRRSAGTRLAGLLISGYHEQAVLGIPRDLPLLVTTAKGKRRDCGQGFYAYKAGPELLRADGEVQKIIGRGIDKFWGGYEGGRIEVGAVAPAGTAWVSSDGYRAEDWSTARFPSGQKGLDRLVEMGLLRRATAADIDAWVEAASAPYRRFDPTMKVDPPHHREGYVVLGPMRYPQGLYGAHSVAFYLPAGVPAPTGNPGHSPLYLMQDGSCRGPTCPQDH